MRFVPILSSKHFRHAAFTCSAAYYSFTSVLSILGWDSGLYLPCGTSFIFLNAQWFLFCLLQEIVPPLRTERIFRTNFAWCKVKLHSPAFSGLLKIYVSILFGGICTTTISLLLFIYATYLCQENNLTTSERVMYSSSVEVHKSTFRV